MKSKSIVVFLQVAVAALLLLCLLDGMPWHFYQFVRFAAAAAFCYFSYISFKVSEEERAILFIVLAVLFQPFMPIHLGRVIWNIVDIAVAAYLIWLTVRTRRN